MRRKASSAVPPRMPKLTALRDNAAAQSHEPYGCPDQPGRSSFPSSPLIGASIGLPPQERRDVQIVDLRLRRPRWAFWRLTGSARHGGACRLRIVVSGMLSVPVRATIRGRCTSCGAPRAGAGLTRSAARFRPVATTVTRTSSCSSGSSAVPTTTVASSEANWWTTWPISSNSRIVRFGPAVTLTRMPQAPDRLTSSSNGLLIAASAAATARSSPRAMPRAHHRHAHLAT